MLVYQRVVWNYCQKKEQTTINNIFFFTLNSQTWNQPNIKTRCSIFWSSLPTFIFFWPQKMAHLFFVHLNQNPGLHGVPKCPKLGQAQLLAWQLSSLAWIELLSVVVTSEETSGPRNPGVASGLWSPGIILKINPWFWGGEIRSYGSGDFFVQVRIVWS